MRAKAARIDDDAKPAAFGAGRMTALRRVGFALILLTAANAEARGPEYVARLVWRSGEGRRRVVVRERVLYTSDDAVTYRETLLEISRGSRLQYAVRWNDDYSTLNRPLSHTALAVIMLRGRVLLVVQRPDEVADAPATEITLYDVVDSKPRPVLRSFINVNYFFSPRCAHRAGFRLVSDDIDRNRLYLRYHWPRLSKPVQMTTCRDAAEEEVSVLFEWRNGCFARAPGQTVRRLLVLADWERECIPGMGRGVK